MVIKRIQGEKISGTNALWLTSTGRVDFADNTSDYVTILVTHMEEDDLLNLKVGQIFSRGEKICREGQSGNVTGNNLHISAGKGIIARNGWIMNSLGAWVLITTNGTYKPEELFYIDGSFTTVKNSGGLPFRFLPRASAGTLPSEGFN